jgi:hypothetical protein
MHPHFCIELCCIFFIVLCMWQVLCRNKDGTEDIRAISAFINEVERLFQEPKTVPVVLVATCNSKNESTVSYNLYSP